MPDEDGRALASTRTSGGWPEQWPGRAGTDGGRMVRQRSAGGKTWGIVTRSHEQRSLEALGGLLGTFGHHRRRLHRTRKRPFGAGGESRLRL